MLGAQPVLNAGDVQNENLGAGREIGVTTCMISQVRGRTAPHFFHWKHRWSGPATQCPLWVISDLAVSVTAGQCPLLICGHAGPLISTGEGSTLRVKAHYHQN